jgi:hypothetical protein
MSEHDWQPEPLTFTRHADREIGVETVTVDRWPRQIEVDVFVMQNADTSFMDVRGDGTMIHFTVTNGSATYWRVATPAESVNVRYMLESCRLSQP